MSTIGVVDAMDSVFNQSERAMMSQKAQRRMARQKKVEVVWAGPAVVHEQRAVSRVRIRGAGVRKVLFGDSDGSGSTDDVPMVDEPVGQQHRLQSLRKIQLWVWRQQVRDLSVASTLLESRLLDRYLSVVCAATTNAIGWSTVESLTGPTCMERLLHRRQACACRQGCSSGA